MIVFGVSPDQLKVLQHAVASMELKGRDAELVASVAILLRDAKPMKPEQAT